VKTLNCKEKKTEALMPLVRLVSKQIRIKQNISSYPVNSKQDHITIKMLLVNSLKRVQVPMLGNKTDISILQAHII
jgi:hypothetical protein